MPKGEEQQATIKSGLSEKDASLNATGARSQAAMARRRIEIAATIFRQPYAITKEQRREAAEAMEQALDQLQAVSVGLARVQRHLGTVPQRGPHFFEVDDGE